MSALACLPNEFRTLLDGYAAVPTVQGESGGVLTRFEKPGAPARYLKEGTGSVADPYQDLAILHDNLAEFGAETQAALWDGYGVTQPDEARRVAHLRLDELF